jgi:hypothetical protein
VSKNGRIFLFPHFPSFSIFMPLSLHHFSNHILKPGAVAPPLARGSGLPSPGFYPEISGFFEAVGIFIFFYF